MIARSLVAGLLAGLVLIVPGWVSPIASRSPSSVEMESDSLPAAPGDVGRVPALGSNGAAPPGSAFMPFGPQQLPIALFGRPPFTSTYVNMISVEALRAGLSAARKAHIHLIINPVGAYSRFVNPNGTFSLTLWKTRLDRLRGFDFAPYVADGTVLGLELMNEPHNKDKWGGAVMPRDDLDAAAAYAKSLWPYLPVGAGRSDYVKAGAPWRFLDFTNSQYHLRKGDVEEWRKATVAEARAAGVGLLLSINFLAGQKGNTPMTADELRSVGTALAADTDACALTGYVYDAQYLARPGVAAAFDAIAAVARSHPAPPCYAGAVKH